MATRARNIAYHNVRDTRMRSNPEPRDIRIVAAPNVLLCDLTAPSVYPDRLPESRTGINCELIREIPLNHASRGVTVSLKEIAASEASGAQRFQAHVTDA